jgi:hypothetical protein
MFKIVICFAFPDIILLEHEADHSPTFSAEVYNAGVVSSTPPIHFSGVVLWHMGKFN